jgi:hypothetical protein
MGNGCHVIIVGSYSQGSPLKGSSSILPVFESISIFIAIDLLYHPEVGYLVELSSDAQNVKEYLSQATSNPKHIICSCNCGATRADWISYRHDMHECGDYVSRALHRRGGTRSSAAYPHGERCIVDAGAWCCD